MSPVEAGRQSGTLEIGVLGEPSELDPHIINSPSDYRIIWALFEGLVTFDPKTLEARPGVASRWTLSEDRLTYTFHLRPDARWSSGEPVTANDFLYSFQRALTPALGSQYAFLFSAVRGADEFAAGRVPDFAQVGFDSPDPQTVRIHLHQPTPYFLEIMANNPVWYPVHPATIEKRGGLARRGSGWTRPENFVGNGPFTLIEWKPNQSIRLARAASYWGSGDVTLAQIHFRPFDSADALERAFRADQLHVADRLHPERAAVFREQSPSPLLEYDMLMARFVNVHTTQPPLDDVRVRQALALALDRDQLARRVYSGAATPARRIVPVGIPGYVGPEPLTEDVVRARELLASAGFPEGRGFPTLELQVESTSRSKLDEALQASWRENLGVNVNIVRSESRVHWSSLQQKNYQLSIGGWIADYPDATAFLDLWRTGSGWNFTGWNDADYDATLAEAHAASQPADRLASLNRAESMLLAQLPVIPIWFERNLKLVHESVRGWQENPMERTAYRLVSLQPPDAPQ